MQQNKNIDFRQLGLIDYQQAWDYQEALFAGTLAIKKQNRDLPETEQLATPNYLLFCEHPHVYTLGKSGAESNLLINEAMLAQKKASFYKINRGGDITYHGPGQLVGYPIFDLDNFFTDIHQYLRFLEEAVMLTLAEFGLQAGRINGLTGVWLNFEDEKNARKICAMGVKCSRWVTMHGFALNVNPDLDYFRNIIPCGIQDKKVSSLKQELNREITIREVAPIVKKHLADLFNAIIAKEKDERAYQL